MKTIKNEIKIERSVKIPSEVLQSLRVKIEPGNLLFAKDKLHHNKHRTTIPKSFFINILSTIFAVFICKVHEYTLSTIRMSF